MHNHSCGCASHERHGAEGHHSHGSCTCGHGAAHEAHHGQDACACGHAHAHPVVRPEPLDAAWDMLSAAPKQEEAAPACEFDFAWEGQSIHVYQWGNEENTPIVMLHGFMQTGLSWAGIANRLSANHCVYALDFLGHGKSSKPHDAPLYSYDSQVRMVEAFLEQVACACAQPGQKRRAHVLGYSMGGRIALALAASSKDLVYSLILESCNFGPEGESGREEAEKRNLKWAEMLREQGIQRFVEYWETLPMFASQQELGYDEVLRAERAANDAEAMALSLEGAGKHAMPDAQGAFAAIASTWVPVKYLWGYDDVKSEAVAHRLEHDGIDVTSFGAGHNVHLEAPTLYTTVVQEFLSGIEPKGIR